MDVHQRVRAETERVDRRVRSAFSVLPYLLLAICLVITLLIGEVDTHPTRALVVFVLSAVAAAWIAAFTILRRDGRTGPLLRGLFYAGFTVLAAALVLLAPWYGVFAFIGYHLAYEMLPGRWSYVGAASTSLIMAVSYLGGIDRIDGTGWGLWLGIGVVSTVLASVFFQLVTAMDSQMDRQQEALAQLHEANERLESALAENAELHAKLLVQAREAGVQDERERLAREIHDTLAQGLAGILTQLQGAQETLEDPNTTRRRLDLAVGLARDGLVEARRSVHAVGPALLARSHLPAAVEDAARRWSREHGIDAEASVVGDPRPLHEDIEETVLRAAQEALANVAAHARAQRVGLTLTYMDDLVSLDVRDDGSGFDPEGHTPVTGRGYGLSGMRRRVQRLTGRLVVESAPGEGTALSISLPAIPSEHEGVRR